MADQQTGYFGWTVARTGESSQPLHRGVVEIGEALDNTRELTTMFFTAREFPESPPFTGGVLDSWPSVAVDAFRICRQELAAVEAFLKQEAGRG
mgnify:CR=1 FL=1